jgi:hypothetical protein
VWLDWWFRPLFTGMIIYDEAAPVNGGAAERNTWVRCSSLTVRATRARAMRVPRLCWPRGDRRSPALRCSCRFGACCRCTITGSSWHSRSDADARAPCTAGAGAHRHGQVLLATMIVALSDLEIQAPVVLVVLVLHFALLVVVSAFVEPRQTRETVFHGSLLLSLALLVSIERLRPESGWLFVALVGLQVGARTSRLAHTFRAIAVAHASAPHVRRRWLPGSSTSLSLCVSAIASRP